MREKLPERWNEVIVRAPFGTLTKQDVFDYYSTPRVQKAILDAIENREVVVRQNFAPDASILRRKNRAGNPIKQKDLPGLLETRATEIHPTFGKKVDFVLADIDPHGVSWDKTKTITELVAKTMASHPDVKDVSVRFSGGEGFYVQGKLDKQVSVDSARALSKQILDGIARRPDVTTGVASQGQIRLDTTPLKYRGSIRAPYSLNAETGLVSAPIALKDLAGARKLDFTVKSILKKASELSRRQHMIVGGGTGLGALGGAAGGAVIGKQLPVGRWGGAGLGALLGGGLGLLVSSKLEPLINREAHQRASASAEADFALDLDREIPGFSDAILHGDDSTLKQLRATLPPERQQAWQEAYDKGFKRAALKTATVELRHATPEQLAKFRKFVAETPKGPFANIRMPFPSAYRAALKRGTKNTTVRGGDELGAYTVGHEYDTPAGKIRVDSCTRTTTDALQELGLPPRAVRRAFRELGEAEPVDVLRFSKVSREFAPGIPMNRDIKKIPTVKDQPWTLAVQFHKALKAGPHWDLRLVPGIGGDAHSWAIPKAQLPEAGKIQLAIQQPTHTADYALHFKGTIPKGTYGAGKVTMPIKEQVNVISASPKKIVFERPNQDQFMLFRMEGRKWGIRKVSEDTLCRVQKNAKKKRATAFIRQKLRLM